MLYSIEYIDYISKLYIALLNKLYYSIIVRYTRMYINIT